VSVVHAGTWIYDRHVPVRPIALSCSLIALAAPLACSDDGATTGESSPTGSGAGGQGTTTSLAATGAGGSGGADPGPPPGNAVMLADGSVMPLYAVGAEDLGTRAIGFTTDGPVVTARDERGDPIWERDLEPGALFGGFDVDADGVPDLGLVRSMDTGAPCGAETMVDTWLDVALGRSGDLVSLVPPLGAICWTFGATAYPTVQWTSLGVLFGGPSDVIATLPYYATEGTFWSYREGAFEPVGTFFHPSTASYDASYTADLPNAWGTGTSHLPNSHVANGLFASVAAEERLLYFTSGRFVAYRPAPLAPDQLVLDRPFLTGGRTDIAGRNYGLVTRDPADEDVLVLVAGTSADTVHADMMSGTMTADPWGQIERHVTFVDLAAAAVDDRFFSYAHDGGDAYQYEGRVVYPDGIFVRTPSGPSRIAFNVYEGGKWRVHVTAPGATADAIILADRFLWDIRDLNGDGLDEWILSPTRDPSDPDVPGYYFTKWRTVLARWDEPAGATVELAVIEGMIPSLVASFRAADKTTSRGALYPVLIERLTTGELALLLTGPGGPTERVPLPAL
jgi:hypothetical protein